MLDQTARELKKTADALITQSIAQAKEKLVSAANDAIRSAENCQQVAQTEFQQLQPKAKEAFKSAIDELHHAAQEFKQILKTAGSSK